MNMTMMKWCRIKVENKMSVCCDNAEFAKGTADSCKEDCKADCVHVKMQEMCDKYFGKACTFERKLFANLSGFTVDETFCVPKECDNSNDLKNNALVLWYHNGYLNRRVGVRWLE